MVDKKPIDAEFKVVKEKSSSNPFNEGPVDTAFKVKRSKKEAFFHGVKRTGTLAKKGTVAAAKGTIKAGQLSAKAGNAVYSGASKTYRGIGRANAAHRNRVLQKEIHRKNLLELKVQRTILKQQLPPKRATQSPLSDRGLKRVFVGKKKVSTGTRKGPSFWD